MARIEREALLARFRDDDPKRPADRRRRRRHRPLGQVRGDRRHRPDRDLQFRPLPHGRTRVARRAARLRQRERDRARDGARGAAGGAAYAGAGRRQRHRSFLHLRRFSGAAEGPRLLRYPELSDGRPDRWHFPRQPRGDRHGLWPGGRPGAQGPRAGSSDHAVRVLRGRRPRDDRGRRGHRRGAYGPHSRWIDRRRDGGRAGRVRAAHRGDRQGGARGARRRHRAVPRRPDRDARGCRPHPGALRELPRLLWRKLHGAPADRGGADRADPPLQGDPPASRTGGHSRLRRRRRSGCRRDRSTACVRSRGRTGRGGPDRSRALPRCSRRSGGPGRSRP